MKQSSKRVFLIVLDSLGIGEAPDAEKFGDTDSNTLKSIWNTGLLKIDNLLSLGLGNIDGLDFLGGSFNPLGVVARMKERSMGKDTTIGHWEIAGHVSNFPLPTFPDGFPKEFLDKFSKEVGRGVLCNKPYSGTDVIKDFGKAHMESGDLIVYTSADSVFQIAAHKNIVPLEELYEICKTARRLFVGNELGVGRVIARPFAGEAPDFYRTAERRDFSIAPPSCLLPEALKNQGYDSYFVGKIHDIFAGVGFDGGVYTHSNEEGMEAASQFQKMDFCGLCFINLVDFDSLWGHRRDSEKYALGLNKFDRWLGGFIDMMRENDLLIITADHGCDPSFLKTTDHTREYTPCIIYSKNIVSANMGTRESFADIAATVAYLLGAAFECDGEKIELEFEKG